MLLTALIIPLSYYLTVKYGLIGPAIANLVSFSMYNFVRYWFLWKKFGLQPFTYKTAEVILIAITVYGLVFFTMQSMQGFTGLMSRTFVFSTLFISMVYYRNISPDLKPITHSILKKLGLQ